MGSEPGFAWMTWFLPLEIWGLSAPMMLISIVRYGRGFQNVFESRPLTVSTGVIFESFEVCLVSRFCGALAEMEFWS